MKPNARQILIRTEKTGKDELVDKILTDPNSPEARIWPKVADIFDSKTKRSYVEACLMSSADYKTISDLLELPLDVIVLYEKTCFNISNYDRLSKLDLLDKEKEKDVMIMKLWAMNQGLDFIAWRLGKKIEISPLDGLTEMFTMCIYKSKEALFNSNSSTASMESTKWAKLSLDIARMLKIWVLDNDVARRDLELAIKEIVPEFKSFDDLIAEDEKAKAETESTPVSEEAQHIMNEILEQNNEDDSGDNTRSD